MVSGAGIADPKSGRPAISSAPGRYPPGAGVDLSPMNLRDRALRAAPPWAWLALAASARRCGARCEPPASAWTGPSAAARSPRGKRIVLCVPDAEIPAAAEVVTAAAPYVGHTSGATRLTALEPAGVDAFGLHPLQTFTGDEGPEAFAGAGCAIAGLHPRGARGRRASSPRHSA